MKYSFQNKLSYIFRFIFLLEDNNFNHNNDSVSGMVVSQKKRKCYHLTLNLPDEGYFKNETCALNEISVVLLSLIKIG